MTSLPVSAPSGRGEAKVEGGARGRQRQSPSTITRQHQVHWRVVQVEDADRNHHAWLHCETAEEPRRREFRVSVPAAVDHREGPGFWEGEGDARTLHLGPAESVCMYVNIELCLFFCLFSPEWINISTRWRKLLRSGKPLPEFASCCRTLLIYDG